MAASSRRSCRQRGLTGSLAVLVLLTTAACGAGAEKAADPPPVDSTSIGVPSADPALSAAVPDPVREAGVLEVGTSATYEPMIFRAADGEEIIGFDVDLLDAVAAKFGLRTHWTSKNFPTLLKGVQNGTFDVGASSISVTADRAKIMKLVGYLDTGARWAVAAGNPSGINPAKACGLTVAVTAGSKFQTQDLPARNKACPADDQIEIVPFPGDDQAAAAVRAGRADAVLADDAAVSWSVRHSGGALETVGDLYDKAQVGYALPESDQAFADGIARALESLKDDGTYAKILAKWGLESSAAETFVVSD